MHRYAYRGTQTIDSSNVAPRERVEAGAVCGTLGCENLTSCSVWLSAVPGLVASSIYSHRLRYVCTFIFIYIFICIHN